MDFLRELIAVVLLQCCLAASAIDSPSCDKMSRFRINFGRERSLSSPNTIGPLSCKYRIVVTQGFHIQMTFEKLDAEPCCSNFKVYDIFSKKRNRWTESSVIPLPYDVSTPGSTAIFTVPMIGVNYERTMGTAGFSIKFRPVVPEGGNCGYPLRTSKRSRILRSPGFPRTKSPAGLRCSWTVVPKEGHVIKLDFFKISTTTAEDYVEVYEGDTMLARYTGENMKITHISRNQLRIYLHTTTSDSKGFKATYTELLENKTEPVIPPSVAPAGTVIKCYNGTKVTGMGITMMNDIKAVDCQPSEVCGFITLKGTTPGFVGAEVLSETGFCLHQDACTDDVCANIQDKAPGMTINSCEATCCNTDLCATTMEETVTPANGGIKCYNGTKATGIGALLINEKHIVECPPFHVCGLYLIRGKTQDKLEGEEIFTETGVCIPESICSFDLCSTVPNNPELTVTSCEASCCNTDLCNAGKEPPKPDEALKCYDILSSRGGDMILVDNKAEKTCPDGSKCTRIEAKATSSLLPPEIEITTVYGGCLPEMACKYLNCSSMPSSVSDMTIKSCKASCCDGDLCNDEDTDSLSTVQPPTKPGVDLVSDLVCYDMFHSSGGGMTFVDTKTEKFCSYGSKCLHMVALTESNGVEVTNIYGSCLPAAVCNNMDCSPVLASINNTAIKSCEVTCCSSNYCNGKKYEATKEPEVPAASGPITCNVVVKMTAMGTDMVNQKTEMPCPAGHVCMMVEAEAGMPSMGNMKANMRYGMCVEEHKCGQDQCLAQLSSMEGLPPGVEFDSCKMECCKTSFCNEP